MEFVLDDEVIAELDDAKVELTVEVNVEEDKLLLVLELVTSEDDDEFEVRWVDVEFEIVETRLVAP